VRPIASLTQDTGAAFLKVSQSVASRVNAHCQIVFDPMNVSDEVRTLLILPQGRQRLLDWVLCQSPMKHWPTLREFKEQIVLLLETERVESPLISWWGYPTLRLIDQEYCICPAPPLELGRDEVRSEDVTEHFRQLESH
jgi:hypothetical protein